MTVQGIGFPDEDHLNIDDTVMQRLREAAARQGRTMSELVEAGLRRILEEEGASDGALPPLPSWSSGGELVDVADRNALYDRIDGDSSKLSWGRRG